jgi:hypothetical protein
VLDAERLRELRELESVKRLSHELEWLTGGRTELRQERGRARPRPDSTNSTTPYFS